jgi:hypothetical protein
MREANRRRTEGYFGGSSVAFFPSSLGVDWSGADWAEPVSAAVGLCVPVAFAAGASGKSVTISPRSERRTPQPAALRNVASKITGQANRRIFAAQKYRRRDDECTGE